MQPVDAANALHSVGLGAFPCRPDKAPAVLRGHSWRDAAAAPVDHPAHNWSSGLVGVPVPEGVVVLDLDLYKGVTRADVDQALGVALPWDAALIQRTQGGGEHYAFRAPAWSVRQGDSLVDLPGFDTRAPGRGYICTGAGYTPAGALGVFAMAYPDGLPPLPDACRDALGAREPTTPAEHPTPSDMAHDDVVAALRHIDPGTSRAEWVRVGLALRHHYRDDMDKGRAVFDAWSSGAYWPHGCPDNYEPDDIDKQWGSFKPDGGVTVATLYYRALQGGWSPPSTFDTAAAFGSGAAPTAAFEALVARIHESGADIRQTQAIIDEIKAAGCNGLQIALLADTLKDALRGAGVKSSTVGKLIDQLLPVHTAVPLHMEGALPVDGAVLDSDTPLLPAAWAPMQTKGKAMKPKGTLTNFRIMLAAYGVTVRFDEIAKELRIHGPGVPGPGVLHDEAALSYLDSLAALNEYPGGQVRAMVAPLANEQVENPVRDWVAAGPWDGADHIGHLWAQLTLEAGQDAELGELLFRRWFRGAYAIGTGQISRWEHVLVLVDPWGGAGKTRFVATLCPPQLRADSVILDTTNKDSIKLAISRWICELGELDATFNRSDQARLKAFLSAQRDEMRLPYGRAYLAFPRRTAFWASVNEPRFLVDQSNNRRFWPLRVSHVNHLHDVNTQQVWAQAAAELAAGAPCYLSAEEEQRLLHHNDGFRQASRVSDLLGDLRVLPAPDGAVRTPTELAALAGVGNPTRGDLNEVSAWMRRRRMPEGRGGFRVTVETGTAGAFGVVDGGV